MSKYKDLVMEQKKNPNEVNPVLFQINDLYGTASFPAHFHDEIEILHVLCGEIKVMIFDKAYTLSKGALCFIDSMAIHTIYNGANISKYDCCLMNVPFYLKQSININEYSISPIITDSEIVKDFVKLKNVFNNQEQLFGNILLRSLSICFFINLINRCSFKSSIHSFKNDKKIEIVKEVSMFLNEHSSENIDIDAICQKYGYSPSYLSRLFKKYTNTTMTKTLNNYRCLNAQRLLMTENLSVTEVCEMCGYSNYSYFTKTYKEYIGELTSTTKSKYYT